MQYSQFGIGKYGVCDDFDLIVAEVELLEMAQVVSGLHSFDSVELEVEYSEEGQIV